MEYRRNCRANRMMRTALRREAVHRPLAHEMPNHKAPDSICISAAANWYRP